MEGLELYAATARRSVRRHGIRPHRALGSLDPAMVFVVGCPRSGTTFTAGAIGSVPGYFDLGEVNRLKAAVPDLHGACRAGLEAEVTAELGRVLRRAQRVAFAAGRRGVEQTPEATFLIGPLSKAFPAAQFVHLVRDGRDVVASLVERGWLAPDRGGVDDAGLPVGRYARFWVEPDRAREFEESSEVRRCAWAWRRYESTAASELARLDPARVVHVRYEELAAAPADVAARVGDTLGGAPTAAFVQAFSGMHAASVGRHERVLTPAQVAEVRTEVGDLLQELGYGGTHPAG
jgi:hypothetical protein